MKKPFQKVTIQDCSDERGFLKVISHGRELPFEIKRAFFTYGHSAASVRGGHAHFCAREAFVCLQGSCNLFAADGEQTYSFVLNDPGEILIVEPLTWKKLEHFSRDCILLVLSDCLYDASDYVNDYETFLRICKENKTRGCAAESAPAE